MCQAEGERKFGWKGWQSLPVSPWTAAGGDWIDLSYPLGESTPVHRATRSGSSGSWAFPEARFERIKSMPADPVNITRIEMVVHMGTHVDAPNHFIADGPAFHEIPLDRLYGRGVVLHLQCDPFHPITAAELSAASPAPGAGDIVLLSTGWTRHAGTPRFDEHPYLTADAATWLARAGIKLLAVDFPSPDLPIVRRDPEFDWPVHHILLSQGVLVAENLRLSDKLSPGPAEFIFLALNIEGADGAPARVIGRNIGDR